MVDPHRGDHAAVQLAVGGGDDGHILAVFGVEETVTNRPATACRRLRGLLLRVQRLIELLSEAAAQPGQVGMTKRVQRPSPLARRPGKSLPTEQEAFSSLPSRGGGVLTSSREEILSRPGFFGKEVAPAVREAVQRERG